MAESLKKSIRFPEGSPERGSKKSLKEDDNSLPLLDEVASLIEKEKTLLSLKLMDQEQQAISWKQKYDELVGKVLNFEGADQIPAIDELKSAEGSYGESNHAENDEYSQNHGKIMITPSVVDKASILTRLSFDKRILDLSYVNLSNKPALQTISKFMAGKSRNESESNNIEILIMNHCELNDSCTELLDIIAHSSFKSIDLSFNYLSIEFQIKLVDIYKNFNRSPEVFLLHGNVLRNEDSNNASAGTAATDQNISIESFVDAFTDSTWGISLTLPDFDMLTTRTMPKKQLRNNSMQESPTHLMYCRKFLQTLNHSLDPAAAQGQKKKPTNPSKKADLIISRRGGLRLLSSLELSHAHISKLSIKELQRTIQLTFSTLTDLDLSFAYVGFTGAEMLKEILMDKACNIVRLGLKGNGIGNRGFEELGIGLQSNRSLTTLDCQSNSIGNEGVRLFIKSLLKTEEKSSNTMLSIINLKGNHDITNGAKLLTNQTIYDNGLNICIKWEEFSTINEDPIPSSATILLSNPHKVIRELDSSGYALLHKIDLQQLYLSAASPILSSAHILSFQYQWRPTNRILSLAEISWCITIKSSRGETLVTQQHPISSSSSKVSSLQKHQQYPWFKCSNSMLLESGLPTHGFVEISVLSPRSKGSTLIESVGLNIYTSSANTRPIVGTDTLTYSPSELAMYATFSQGDRIPVNGHSILRSFIWTSRVYHHHAIDLNPSQKSTPDERIIMPKEALQKHTYSAGVLTALLKLQTKLGPHHSIKPSIKQNSLSIGYEWSVGIMKASGLFTIVKSGQSTLPSHAIDEQELNDTENAPALTWKPIEVELPGNLSPGDHVILSGMPVGAESSLFELVAKSCHVSGMESNGLASQSESLYGSVVYGTCILNDPTMAIFM